MSNDRNSPVLMDSAQHRKREMTRTKDFADTRSKLKEQLRYLVKQSKQADLDQAAIGGAHCGSWATGPKHGRGRETAEHVASTEIKQIKRAIHMIDRGTYGICKHCGSKISSRRLSLLPYGKTCTDCALDCQRAVKPAWYLA